MRISQTDGDDDGEGQKGRQEVLTHFGAVWGDSRRLPPLSHHEFFNEHGDLGMCFGSKSKAAPPPAQPTTFQYGPADYSNSQQQKAAILQDSPSNTQSSFGSELGTGSTTPATSSNPNG